LVENSKKSFSAISCLEYFQLQLDTISQPKIVLFFSNIKIGLFLTEFYYGPPMNSQNDLVHVPNAMKQNNMHNIRTSRIS